MCLILDGLISFLSTLQPVPACEMNTDMTSLLYYHCSDCRARSRHSHIHTCTHSPTRTNAARKNISSVSDLAAPTCWTQDRSQADISTGSVFLTDSACGTASAQGQLKGLGRVIQHWNASRPLQTCVCVCVCESLWQREMSSELT